MSQNADMAGTKIAGAGHSSWLINLTGGVRYGMVHRGAFRRCVGGRDRPNHAQLELRDF